MSTDIDGGIPAKPSMEQCYENLIVIDVGANLTNKKYSRDLDSVVQRAKDAGKSRSRRRATTSPVYAQVFRGAEDNGHGNVRQEHEGGAAADQDISRRLVLDRG